MLQGLEEWLSSRLSGGLGKGCVGAEVFKVELASDQSVVCVYGLPLDLDEVVDDPPWCVFELPGDSEPLSLEHLVKAAGRVWHRLGCGMFERCYVGWHDDVTVVDVGTGESVTHA